MEREHRQRRAFVAETQILRYVDLYLKRLCKSDSRETKPVLRIPLQIVLADSIVFLVRTL